ncbi:MAG: hypothetical protein ACI841_002905 [Planctomycetota bacterium]|jgi:hypothetical protein
MKLSHLWWTTFLLTTLCTDLVSAQAFRPPVLRTWAKTFEGRSHVEGIYDLRREPDGNIRVASYSWGSNTGIATGSLLYLDGNDGSTRLRSSISHSSTNTYVTGAGLSADGGALFLGAHNVQIFTSQDASVVRLDESGTPSWSHAFTSPGDVLLNLFDAVELSNGSWVMAGGRIATTIGWDAWIVRMSAAGSVEWQYEYGSGLDEQTASITATSAGGTVVAGNLWSTQTGDRDAWVIKLDSLGAIEWQKTYELGGLDQAFAIVELAGGGYAMSGMTKTGSTANPRPWMARLDSAGDVLWYRIVDVSWGDWNGITESSNGGLAAVGRARANGSSEMDLYAIEFALNGDLRWQRAYQCEGSATGASILALPGSRFVLGGTWNRGANLSADAPWVIQTGKDAALPMCDLVSMTAYPILSPVVVAQDGVAVRRLATAVANAVSFEASPSTQASTERCH